MRSTEATLAASTDIDPIAGAVDLDVPAAELWDWFRQPRLWPHWNPCIYWTWNRDLVPGRRLLWCFQPVRWWLPYKLPAVARIAEVEPGSRVTWEVTALPGFYARHTYFLEDLGNGRTRFGSWERAHGWGLRLTRPFWKAHFTFVKDQSLRGAERLAALRARGQLTPTGMPRRRYRLFWSVILALLLLLSAGAWMYAKFLHPDYRQVAPGVWAALHGGANSLVVRDAGEVLIVDPKFPPASRWLARWVRNNLKGRVTTIVNTHHHFDHTQGNAQFPGVRAVAHHAAPAAMLRADAPLWRRQSSALPGPAPLVAGVATLRVGALDIELRHWGRGHTSNDLTVRIERGAQTIIATGDLVFHGYYPFIDTTPDGADLPRMIATIRTLARDDPQAIFVPGHGPLATALDLIRYADYLESLSAEVRQARARSLSASDAADSIDLARWRLGWLPILHYGLLRTSAASNIHAVYHLQALSPRP